MEFLGLNVDVLRIILEYLPQKDLKSLRLANKALKSYAQLTIPRLFLSPNRTNIEVFKNVVNHDDYKFHVQEIVWDDGRLEYYSPEIIPGFDLDSELDTSREHNHQNMIDFARYTDTRDLLRDYPILELRQEEMWGSDAQHISIEESFQIYCRLYNEQQHIIEIGEDVEVLRLGLQQLPNLKRVTLTSEAWRLYTYFPLYETPFFRSLKPGMKMVYPWPWLGCDGGDIDEELQKIKDLRTPWDEPLEEWRGYFIVVSELLATTAHHNVREFVVDVHREPTGLSQHLFCTPSRALQDTEIMFRTLDLTRLDLALNMEIMKIEHNSWFWKHPFLKRALSHLHNLQHFHLHLSPMEVYGDDWRQINETPCISLQDILPTPHETVWRRLQSLGLANIPTTEDSLYTLISTLPALTNIDLDTLRLRERLTRDWEYKEARSLLSRIKTNLIDNEDGAWRTHQPCWTIRYETGNGTNRSTFYNDVIGSYLYRDGDNPFLPHHQMQHPPDVVEWDVDDFDPGYAIPNLGIGKTSLEDPSPQRFHGLMLYPLSLTARSSTRYDTSESATW